MENKEKETNISLEEAFKRLEETISALEGEDVPLEKSFELFKEGMDLVKTCESEIDSVEKKVTLLGRDGETGEFS